MGAYYSTRPDATFFLDQSKTVRITGTITNREGNPVEGVTVTGSNPNNNIKAVTDAEGRYEIPISPLAGDRQVSKPIRKAIRRAGSTAR